MLMTKWRNGRGAQFAKLLLHFLIPWSWSSNALTTRCEELSNWKRPGCCKRSRVGGEGGDTRIRWVDGIIDTVDMSEPTRSDSKGQGSLVCCSPWGHNELDMTEWLNNTNIPCEPRGTHEWEIVWGLSLPSYRKKKTDSEQCRDWFKSHRK